MAKVDPFSVLYSKKVSALDFKWDTMVAPPLLSLMSPQDIYALNQIAMSNRLASDPDKKYKMIDNILVNRGFKKIASGTNRVAYKYLENQNLCLKVAIDRVGLKDNPAEFKNQFKLKPFVVRLFEVSPCGTVALEERVEPLTHIEEYANIIDDVFNFIVEKIIGKYVVDDIGTKYWQNVGIRKSFGPVLLDFPYVYEIDGAKLHCNWMNPDTHEYCLGDIDYDDGFNKLVCNKCGKEYFAKQLAKQVEERTVIIDNLKGEIPHMAIKLMRGNEIVREFSTERESSVITPPTKKESPLVKVRLKNKGKFNKRQQEKEKRDEEHTKAVKEANERYTERMQRQVRTGLDNLYNTAPQDSEESDTREVTLGELSGNPETYLQNSRFEKAKVRVEPEVKEETRTINISEQNNGLTMSMGDAIKRAFGNDIFKPIQVEDKDEILQSHIKKCNDNMQQIRDSVSAQPMVDFHKEDPDVLKDDEQVASDNIAGTEVIYIDTEDGMSDIVEVATSESVLPEEDPDDDSVRYLNNTKYTKVDAKEPTSEEVEVTEEMARGSSWGNPVKCSEVVIELEEDDSVLELY